MSGEAHGPDISTLIGNAKGELGTMPKILPDQHWGIDPLSGVEPPHAKALRERIAQNMTKPPSESSKVEVVVKPKPQILDSIRWALVPTGDANTEESPALGEHFHAQTDEERKADLSARAEAYNKTTQEQYYLPGQVLGRFGSFHRGLSRAVNGAMPEELQAMLVLSGDYGYGRQSDSYAEQVHYAAASVLRKDENGDSSSWRGIDGYIPQGAAKAVLDKAQQAKQGVPLTEDDLTRCMLTALACGGPLEALQMASLAKDYVRLPRGEKESEKYNAGQIVVGRLMTRYGENSFDRAYALSPESTKRRTDAQFATLDKNPKYSDLLQYPGVPLLIEKAKFRIDERLHREQSGWYEAQKVRDVSALGATLDTEHLALLCEQTAIEGGQFEVVEAEISSRSQAAIDGKIANMIGAELVRRLHPELTIANVRADLKARAIDWQGGRALGFHRYNEYRTVFDGTDTTRLAPADRQKMVQDKASNSETMNEAVSREFDWRGPQRLKSLTILLTNPTYYTHALSEQIRRIEDPIFARKSSEQIAQALIQGVTFLQAICEDENIRAIAERELGLAGYLDPGEEGALDKAQAALRRTFADQKDAESDKTKNSGLTLYDTALAEGQLESDAEVVDLIKQQRLREITTLSEQKITEVRAILRTSVTSITQELQEMASQRESRDGLLSQRHELEEKKVVLIDEQKGVKNWQVADSWVERKLHKDWPTSAEKAAKLASIAISIQTTEQDIISLQGDIDQLSVATDEQIALKQKRADGIARLAKQAHAVE